MSQNPDRRKFVFTSTIALVTGLTAPVIAQAAKPMLKTRRLNNVMIAVSDLDKSVDFYQKLFGAPAIDGDVAIIRIGDGPHFLGLTQVKNGGQPGFLSYGLTVENFDPARVSNALSAMGAQSEITHRAGTPEIWALRS